MIGYGYPAPLSHGGGVAARPVATVLIDGFPFYVFASENPGCAPSSQPAPLPAASDAGPETSSGAAGTSELVGARRPAGHLLRGGVLAAWPHASPSAPTT